MGTDVAGNRSFCPKSDTTARTFTLSQDEKTPDCRRLHAETPQDSEVSQL